VIRKESIVQISIQIAADAVPWPSSGLRRASVQSFGFGGSNSHVVLDDALHFMRLNGLQGHHKTQLLSRVGGFPGAIRNDVNNALSPTIPRLLVWSTVDEEGIARTRDAWRNYTEHISQAAQWSKGHDHLGDVAYTLAARRSHFPWRTMAVVKSIETFADVANIMSRPTRAAASPQLGLVFTGVSHPEWSLATID
jgi:acyl transferase domain-containing protein